MHKANKKLLKMDTRAIAQTRPDLANVDQSIAVISDGSSSTNPTRHLLHSESAAVPHHELPSPVTSDDYGSKSFAAEIDGTPVSPELPSYASVIRGSRPSMPSHEKHSDSSLDSV